MAAMATVSTTAVMFQFSSLGITVTSPANARNLRLNTVQSVGWRLANNRTGRRRSVFVRAEGNPRKVDEFAEGVKTDVSKNADNFGTNILPEKFDEAGKGVKDAGKDFAAKTQLAADAAQGKVAEAGDKAREVGDEVKTSVSNTLGAATDKSDG